MKMLVNVKVDVTELYGVYKDLNPLFDGDVKERLVEDLQGDLVGLDYSVVSTELVESRLDEERRWTRDEWDNDPSVLEFRKLMNDLRSYPDPEILSEGSIENWGLISEKLGSLNVLLKDFMDYWTGDDEDEDEGEDPSIVRECEINGKIIELRIK